MVWWLFLVIWGALAIAAAGVYVLMARARRQRDQLLGESYDHLSRVLAEHRAKEHLERRE